MSTSEFTDNTTQSRPQLPKEKIYDEQIHSLVAQITDICRKNRIAMIIDISLDEAPDGKSHLKVTSINASKECDPPMNMLLAARHLHPETATQSENAVLRALSFIDSMGLTELFASGSSPLTSQSSTENSES